MPQNRKLTISSSLHLRSSSNDIRFSCFLKYFRFGRLEIEPRVSKGFDMRQQSLNEWDETHPENHEEKVRKKNSYKTPTKTNGSHDFFLFELFFFFRKQFSAKVQHILKKKKSNIFFPYNIFIPTLSSSLLFPLRIFFFRKTLSILQLHFFLLLYLTRLMNSPASPREPCI